MTNTISNQIAVRRDQSRMHDVQEKSRDLPRFGERLRSEDRTNRAGHNKALPEDFQHTKDTRSHIAPAKPLVSTAPLTSLEADLLRARTLEELRAIVRAVEIGVTDPWQLTELVFYARHPEMIGMPLTKEHQTLLDEWNEISALLVHPALNQASQTLNTQPLSSDFTDSKASELHQRVGSETWYNADAYSSANSIRRTSEATNRFDDVIARAVESCPGLAPSILKGLLMQESNFDTKVINKYGYAGIAQFGRAAAREVGLQVGIAGTASDERLDPRRAIPAAARLLSIKAQRLSETAFAHYGQPRGIEFWKFVTAAYNGGEGTVTLAMGHAYRHGMSEARRKGLAGLEAVSYAQSYATQWENLRLGGLSSPLGMAASRYFPHLAATKYHEIGSYPVAIVARALQIQN